MSDRNGGTSENENRRRLDQIEDVIQSMITLTLEQGKMYDRQHEQTLAEIREQRAEIQDLIALQKEHRIDIMALFQSQKNLKGGGAPS
jgi:phage/plasmid primase-like uncharacterized protein